MKTIYPRRTNGISGSKDKEIRSLYRKSIPDSMGEGSSRYIKDGIKKYLRHGCSLGQHWDTDEAFLQEVGRLYHNKRRHVEIESCDYFEVGVRVPPPKPLRYRTTEARRRKQQSMRARAIAQHLQKTSTSGFQGKVMRG